MIYCIRWELYNELRTALSKPKIDYCATTDDVINYINATFGLKHKVTKLELR
jgi:hypothetical protein